MPLLDLIHYLFEDISSIEIDPNIFYFYQIGIVIGIVVVTTLTFFPGESLGIDYVGLGTEKHSYEKDKAESKTDEDSYERPTRHQHEQVMNADDAHLFYRTLNAMVYIVAFSLFLYFIDKDYKLHIAIWFATYFPREARTLGLFVPMDHL